MTEKPTSERYRPILLLGPPGCGKGTQGRVLGELPGFFFVSMGAVLRSLDSGTGPGAQARPYLEAGDLVPPDVVVSVWLQHMTEQTETRRFDCRDQTLLLDGLPRNVEQAEMLQAHIRPEQVIHFACEDESLLIERIRHRSAARKDDAQDDVIRHRFDVYREETAPLLSWYPSKTIVNVDALRSPLEVLGQIVGALIERNRA